MHLSTHAPHLHVPAVRLPVATVLLTVVYAAALVIALTAPGEHALAGLVVLTGLVGRTVVRRRRTATAPVSATAVDALPVAAPVAAPAPAAAA